ncbi:hypothetical protein [Caproicibacter sp.]|uniref:hypothetical protein n=1 Tax=Caproicibacter sp. TaxID=2814884 RepID=UPI00398A32FB
MACIKCGGPTENNRTLCEKCSAEKENRNRKSPKWRPAIIALASVFVVLIGAAAVGRFFFARDVMELIQGKTRYAQNIELATAKSSVGQIVSGLDKGVGLFKSYSKPKTMDSDLQLKMKAEDQLLKGMNLPEKNFAPVQQALSYLNSLKVNVRTIVDEKGTQTSFTVTDPSALKLTVDSLTYSDGKMYLHMPELLGKYIQVGNQQGSGISPYSFSTIKYDPAKLRASLEKLAAVYVDSLSAAKMKAENNQSVTVDGVTVQGQKLTASLTAEQTAKMAKAIAQAAKNDGDLYAFVSDNYSLFSAVAGNPEPSQKLTKDGYGKLIDELLSKLDLEKDGSAFSAVAYLSQNGDLLAHSYEFQTTTDKAQLNYLISDKKYAIEFLVNQKEGFAFTNTQTGDGAGKMQLKIKNEQEPKNIGVTVNYSGCKTVSFLGSDTMAGKLVVSLYDPDHEIGKYIQQAGLPEAFNQLDQSTLTLESVPDGDKLNSTVQLSMPGLLSFSLTGKTSGVSGGASVQTRPEPNQVIDPAKDESGEAMNELPINGIKFLAQTLKKDPELAAVLSGFGISEEQIELLAAFAQG